MSLQPQAEASKLPKGPRTGEVSDTVMVIVDEDGYISEDTLSSVSSDDGMTEDLDDMSIDDDSATDEDYEYDIPETKQEKKELRKELKKELKALSPLTSTAWQKAVSDVPDFAPLDTETGTYSLPGPRYDWVKTSDQGSPIEPLVTLYSPNDSAARKLWRQYNARDHGKRKLSSEEDLSTKDFLPTIPCNTFVTRVHLDIGLAPEIEFASIVAGVMDQLKLGIFLTHLSIHLRKCSGTSRGSYVEKLARQLREWDRENVQCRCLVEITTDIEDEAVKDALAFSMKVEKRRLEDLEAYLTEAAAMAESSSDSDSHSDSDMDNDCE